MLLYSAKSNVQSLLNKLKNLSGGDVATTQVSTSSIIETIGSLAIVMISGDIVLHSGLSVDTQAQIGVCDLDTINAAINTVQNDDTITSVLFWFNTCGGVANGLYRTWDAIDALSQTKFCVAFSDSSMASAGCLLASACPVIVSTSDSTIGAIGSVLTICTDPDYTIISSGEYKAALNGQLDTKAQDDYLQNMVNQEMEHFWNVANVKHTLNDELKLGGVYRFDDQTELGLVEFQVNNFKELALALL